jgi:hypothetical protein
LKFSRPEVFSHQFLATRLSKSALKVILSLAFTPPKTSTSHHSINRASIDFIKQIAIFIMAGGSQPHDAAVGSPAPKQMGRATVDTLK